MSIFSIFAPTEGALSEMLERITLGGIASAMVCVGTVRLCEAVEKLGRCYLESVRGRA
jgi:hypothetical protein